MPALAAAFEVARRVPFEAWAWTAGLVALACADPSAPGLLDVCGWRWLGVPGLLGFERGPGCGLGHAVAFLLDGRLAESLQAHPLAPFAVAVLGGRTLVLVRGALPSDAAQPADE